MSKRSRDLGLCVGVRVACCGPPHPNRDRDRDRERGGGGDDIHQRQQQQQQTSQPLDLYGVITREGSAANGGWFEVQLDSQPDKKVYYRRGSICKLKQQHSQHQHKHQAAVVALSHPALVQHSDAAAVAAAVAMPATLLSSPPSPSFLTMQRHEHAFHCSVPHGAVLLRQYTASPPFGPVCTCALACSPPLSSTALSFLSSPSARRASTGSVSHPLPLPISSSDNLKADSAGAAHSLGEGTGSGVAVDSMSLISAAASRSASLPSRPLLLGSASSSSAFTTVSSSSLSSSPSTVSSSSSSSVVAPRAVRLVHPSVDRPLSLTSLPAAVLTLPKSVAVPTALRPSLAHVQPAASHTEASSALQHCLDGHSKKRRVSVEEAESRMHGLAAVACSTTACVPHALVMPALCQPTPLYSL